MVLGVQNGSVEVKGHVCMKGQPPGNVFLALCIKTEQNYKAN